MAHSATARLMTHPAPLARSSRSHAGAEQRPAEALGERLGAGGQADGVGADHPGPVGRDVAAPDGGEAEDEAAGHGRGEDQPEHEQQVAGPRLLARRPASSRAPSRPRSRPATARTRPARRCQAQCRRRKRGANWSTPRSANVVAPDDVDDEREREAGEPRVGGQHLRATGELNEPQGPGHERDRAQRDQRRRDRPARTARPPRRRWSAAAVGHAGASVRDLGDREQREAEVAEPGQQPVQRGLVRDRAPDQGGAVGVGASGSSRRTSSPTAGRAAPGGGSRTSRSPALLVFMSAS